MDAATIPAWLHLVCVLMLLTGIVSALVIFVDVILHPQHMTVMNLVWPVTGLYAGPLAV